MSRRARVAGYGAAALLLLVGVACGVLVSGGTGPLLALSLVGLGLVALVSLVFMEVGLSEDRERGRLEAKAQAKAKAKARPAARRRLQGARLDRMRGRRRRLR